MRNRITTYALAGLLGLASCTGGPADTRDAFSSRNTYVTTAERVVIEPHYGEDSMLMDGIKITRYAHGNGLDVPNIEESTVHEKGSMAYNFLETYLTVEVEK